MFYMFWFYNFLIPDKIPFEIGVKVILTMD